MALKGIDVSKHNGTINWSQAKANGVDFAIIRAGYGSLISQKDSTFEYNYQQAKAQGIKLGAYWFSYAESVADAVKEAQVFKQVISGKSFDLPLFFDFEGDSYNYCVKQGVTPSKSLITSMAVAFLNELKNSGHAIGLYANIDYLKNYFTYSQMPNGCKLWLARYTSATADPSSVTKTYGDPYIWQYWSGGKLGTMSCNFDLNHGYFDSGTATITSVSASNSGEVYAQVTASQLNVRTEPDMDATRLPSWSYLSKGNAVSVLESYTNGWSKVRIAGLHEAYVNHSYLSNHCTALKTYCPPVMACTGNNVNVRSGPGTNNAVIGKLNKGNQVDVYSKDGGWYFVNVAGTKGYVHKDYLA